MQNEGRKVFNTPFLIVKDYFEKNYTRDKNGRRSFDFN